MVLRYALERETPQKHASVWIAKKPVGGIGKTAEVAGLSFSEPRKAKAGHGAIHRLQRQHALLYETLGSMSSEKLALLNAWGFSRRFEMAATRRGLIGGCGDSYLTIRGSPIEFLDMNTRCCRKKAA
jgi:hypothetical protein